MRVHLRLADGSVLAADVHDLADFLGALGCEVAQVFDIDARVDLLVELEPVLRVLGEQVSDFFVVDLEVGCAH